MSGGLEGESFLIAEGAATMLAQSTGWLLGKLQRQQQQHAEQMLAASGAACAELEAALERWREDVSEERRAHLATAAHLEEGRALILAMQGSGHAQDAHNARIHGKEWVEHVGRFRRLLGDPTDGQKWWDAAIHGFNARRCYASGAVAMEEVTAKAEAEKALRRRGGAATG